MMMFWLTRNVKNVPSFCKTVDSEKMSVEAKKNKILQNY